ncbi:hypothetical protein MUK70_10555 [Dyadobacter chenwenxiniae]|uniref:Uncharacterized protein n=1 Tax=Dyadobacter chenwenxiniae TaxID=2906456 RepID=A0A9X1PND9_9BACT|nr:hypothetical protein [Dyadobacter chenwenxiniae]MCF0063194.1 hypothetical protein [Dyadobacter chenwenxiniae]UON85426.1 hypothetical protein MUK70_10555 [Dyadobacter chenwenxiniae]
MTAESEHTPPDLNQENTVKIYSKRAIWGFSVFFAPVFGGFLLRQNLMNSNRNKEANLMLLISIVFTVFTGLIVDSIFFVLKLDISFLNQDVHLPHMLLNDKRLGM